jgi:hypothetical protein
MKMEGDITLASHKHTASLQVLVEKEIDTVNLLLVNDLYLNDVDHAIHEIRKFTKATQAALLLYKTKQTLPLYLHWKSYFKVISKQYAALRESKINLQIFYHLEKKIKASNKNNIILIKNHFEEKYNLLANDNQLIEKSIRQLNLSITQASLALSQTLANPDPEILRKKHKKTIHKANQLFKTLTFTSPPDDFHKFRKWMNYIYFQQIALKRAGLQKLNRKQNKQIHKLAVYLGDEHDLQLFQKYLKEHFVDQLAEMEAIISNRIKKLRMKIFTLYPLIKNL